MVMELRYAGKEHSSFSVLFCSGMGKGSTNHSIKAPLVDTDGLAAETMELLAD